MTGLLRKEFYVLKKSMLYDLFLILAFSVLPAGFPVYGILIVGMNAVTSVAYDERCRWDTFAAALPYKPVQLVFVKYLSSWCMILFFDILLETVRMLMMPLHLKATEGYVPFAELVPYFLYAALLMALILPFIIRFGVENGRIIYCLVAGFGFAAVAVFGRFFLNDAVRAGNAAAYCSAVLLLFAAVGAVTAVSIALSTRFYRKRFRA